MSNAPQDKLGVAGAVNALARNVGMITGTTIVTTTLYISMSHQLGRKITTFPVDNPNVFVNGLHFSMFFGMMLVIIAWLLTGYRLILRLKNKI